MLAGRLTAAPLDAANENVSLLHCGAATLLNCGMLKDQNSGVFPGWGSEIRSHSSQLQTSDISISPVVMWIRSELSVFS